MFRIVHCSVASQLWSLAFSVFGVMWVQPETVALMLCGWYGGRVGKRRRKALLFVPHCVTWIIWLERNRRTFQDVSVPTHRLVYFTFMGFWEG